MARGRHKRCVLGLSYWNIGDPRAKGIASVQRHGHRETNGVLRSLAPRVGSALVLGALWGCGSSLSPPVTMPAAHAQVDPRPLRLVPPFELASPSDAVVRLTGEVSCTGTLIADDLVYGASLRCCT